MMRVDRQMAFSRTSRIAHQRKAWHRKFHQSSSFCRTEGQGIFLDLKRDDYSAISIAVGPAGRAELDLDAAITEAFETHRRPLLDAGLVKEDEQGGDAWAFRSLQRPASNIFHPDDQRAFGMQRDLRVDVRIGIGDVVDFFLASHRASCLLKRRHLYEVVRGVRQRKAAADGKVTADDKADRLHALRRTTAIYRQLRPWYPRAYLCMYDGLALIEFLARRQLFPDWVFGVQAQPFGAHCWVQHGDVLLNESSEYAGQFTPIMSV